MPGMYAVISMPEVRRTRATLRRAEFGFLGVVVYTRVHTPLRCGDPLRTGDFDFSRFDWRPWRTSCWIVGNFFLLSDDRASRRISDCSPARGLQSDGPAPGTSPLWIHARMHGPFFLV